MADCKENVESFESDISRIKIPGKLYSLSQIKNITMKSCCDNSNEERAFSQGFNFAKEAIKTKIYECMNDYTLTDGGVVDLVVKILTEENK